MRIIAILRARAEGRLRRRRRAAALASFGAICAVAIAASALAQSSPTTVLRRWVIAGGGGRSAVGGLAVHGTIGQPLVGTSSGGGFRIASGFWPGLRRAQGSGTPTPTSATPTRTPGGTPSATITASPTPGSHTWVVNKTADTHDGSCDPSDCSLREAIDAVNNTGEPYQRIEFGIPAGDPGRDGSGVCTIQVLSAMDEIVADRTTIDGFTQPGATANTSPFGQPINAVLKVVMDGSHLTGCCPTGIRFHSSGNRIQGLVIQGFHTGVHLYDANDNVVVGNFIGTEVTGTVARGSGCNGVDVSGTEGSPGSTRNRIGGDTPADRNLIAGHGCAGVSIAPPGGNRVVGNYIGTDVTGAAPLGNAGDGVYVFNVSQGSRIGGPGSEEPNLIAFNGGNGVEINGGAGAAIRNTITRNRIHSNAGKGIALESGGNQSLAAPVILSAAPRSVSGTASPGCAVEVFSDAADEGAVFEGTVIASADGAWTLATGWALTGPFITATCTDASGNTSEFALPVAISGGPTPTTTKTATPGPSPTASRTPTPGPSPTVTLSPTPGPSPTERPWTFIWLPIVSRGWEREGMP